MKKIFFFAVLIYGCIDKKEGSTEDLFTQQFALEAHTIISQENLLDPVHVAVVDSFIIVSNYNGEPLIEVYSLSGKPLKKIINKGKGPGEVLIVGDIQVDDKRNVFYVCDLIAKKLLECKIEDVIADDNYIPTVLFNKSEAVAADELIFDKVLVGKNKLICESRSPSGRFLLLDSIGNFMSYSVAYPDKELISNNLSDFDNAGLYASASCISPTKDKIAAAAYSAGMIDFYQLTKDKLTPIWSYQEFYPSGVKNINMDGKNLLVHTDESKTGYLDICCSSKYVYALYSGKQLKEADYAWSSTVRVISWDGKETFEYHLDRKVKRIEVRNDTELYAVSKNESEEPEIVVFEL